MLVPGDRLAIHKPFNAQDVSDTSGDYYLLCQGEWVARVVPRAERPQAPRDSNGRVDPRPVEAHHPRDAPPQDGAGGAYPEALLHAFCLSVQHLLHRAHGGQSEFVVSPHEAVHRGPRL